MFQKNKTRKMASWVYMIDMTFSMVSTQNFKLQHSCLLTIVSKTQLWGCTKSLPYFAVVTLPNPFRIKVQIQFRKCSYENDDIDLGIMAYSFKP